MSWANFCSKCTGLNKQTKNLSKFEEKKKLSFGFRDEKQGKKVKIREKLEKIREKTSKCPGLKKNLLILLEIGKYCQKKNHIFLNSTNLRLNFRRKFKIFLNSTTLFIFENSNILTFYTWPCLSALFEFSSKIQIFLHSILGPVYLRFLNFLRKFKYSNILN